MPSAQQIFLEIFPSLLTGVVLAVFNSRFQKTIKERDKSEKARQIEAKLNLDLTFATAQLSYASAMALKRGHANGEVETAVTAYEEALRSYRKFEREQMADL